MTPQVILAMVDGLVGLIEKLAPTFAGMVRSGEITPEQQKALDDRIAALRPGGALFSGPEWKA